MSLVVDASVAFRWYVEAPGTPEACTLLEGDEPLLAPDLVVPEITNIAWKLARAGQISAEHAARIVAAAPSAFSLLVPCSRLADRALSLARRLDHPAYDGFYLALADLEDAPLVTADRRLLTALEREGLSHLARSLL